MERGVYGRGDFPETDAPETPRMNRLLSVPPAITVWGSVLERGMLIG
jgi:hypothetical protein